MSGNARVLTFAAAREVMGRSEFEVPLDAPVTARAFLDALIDGCPALRPYNSSLRVAVNGAYVRWDDEINPGDEVAIIPPVAGG